MSGYLLDTNVISEVVRPRPDRCVARWIESNEEESLFLSVLTLGEIRKGITTLADAPRNALLEAWFTSDLLVRFEGRILPVDQIVADPRVDVVVATSGMDRVITILREDPVIVIATEHQIVALAGFDVVVAVAAIDAVIARAR